MLRRTALLLSFSLLTACGFHLKGTGRHAVTVQETVALEFADVPADVAQTVRDVFLQHGIALSDQEARYRIRLEQATDSRFESVVGGEHGQSRVIDIRKGFTAAIFDKAQLLARQTLVSEASVNYHSEQYLGNIADDERTQRSLKRDNADKLLRFFQATVSQP